MYIRIHPALSFHQPGQRSNQEDARYPNSDVAGADCRTFVVCDGVGGLDRGEVASRTVANAIGSAMEAYRSADRPFGDADFARVLTLGYRALECRNFGQAAGMATTMTFLHLHSGGAYVAHIGDSRIYHIRPGVGILYRSFDHSWVNELVRSGELTPAEAVNHPQSNIITRCMGVQPVSPATCLNIEDLQPGDYFLLCTDGVLHCVDDDWLVALLDAPEDDVAKMSELAHVSAPSSDNNTAFLVHIAAVEGEAPSEQWPAAPGETTARKFHRPPSTREVFPEL